MSTETEIRSLLSAIEPSQTQKDGAKRSHRYLRDLLDTGKMTGRVTGSYLSGSYARTTAIAPLDDVDIIFMIDPRAWDIPFFRSRPRPDSVVDTFERAIRYRYTDSSLRKQRRSVRLRLHHLDIDVVPAIQDRRGDRLWIPDTNEDTWIPTAPKAHGDYATRVNKIRSGQAKPLVKLLKYWNSTLPANAQLKSFAIETMVLRWAEHNAFGSLADGLTMFFDFARRFSHPLYLGRTYGMENVPWSGLKIPDTSGVGSNTAASVNNDRKVDFFKNVTRASQRGIDYALALQGS